MSTQSAAYTTDATRQLNGLYIRERSVTLSNEALVEAADAAFSSRTRLDVGLEREDSLINPLVEGSSSSRSTSRFQLKKRKAIDQEPASVTTSIGLTINTDFLSGIFEDIANAQQASTVPHDDHDEDDLPIFKKPRTSSPMTRSMSRCPKSFACLHTISDDCIDTDSASDNDNLRPPCSQLEEHDNAQAVEAATIVDTIFDIDLPLFPNLPVSVSNSSNSSNNLTQSTVQAVTTAETHNTHVEGSVQGSKDGYGWFVETEDEDTSSPVDLLQLAKQDIAYSVAAAPKSQNHDAELEWARAADTVDDVLADFF